MKINICKDVSKAKYQILLFILEKNLNEIKNITILDHKEKTEICNAIEKCIELYNNCLKTLELTEVKKLIKSAAIICSAETVVKSVICSAEMIFNSLALASRPYFNTPFNDYLEFTNTETKNSKDTKFTIVNKNGSIINSKWSLKDISDYNLMISKLFDLLNQVDNLNKEK